MVNMKQFLVNLLYAKCSITSVNMSLVFENTAKFLERDAAFRKNLKRSLMMPAVTVIAVVGVVLFCRIHFSFNCRTFC